MYFRMKNSVYIDKIYKYNYGEKKSMHGNVEIYLDI